MSNIIERRSDYNETEVKSKEFIYTWKINNFKLLHASAGNFISSQVVANANEKDVLWSVHLYPDGGLVSNETPFVRVVTDYLAVIVHFYSKHLEIKKSAHSFCVYIIDGHSNEHEVYRTTTFFKDYCSIPKLIKRSDVLSGKNDFLPNGDLTLRFKLNYAIDVTRPRLICTAPPAKKPRLSCLEDTFNSEKFNDVKILVGGKVFYAYKGILAAESQVFAAMFEHDMKEKKESAVFIEDFGEEVILELLRFVYVGKVNNIEVMARDLLAAADKYELEELRIMCEESLIKDLDVDSVTDLLIAAERHGAKTLKESALQFFKRRAKEIIQTEAYKANFPKLSCLIQDIIETLV